MQKNDQAEFKLNLSEINKENKQHRSKEQKNTLYNMEMLYKARNSVIKFFDDYLSMISEATLKAAKGTGLKLLTPKKMLQRLPIADNNSQSLSNEIRQFFIICINQKKLLKKYIIT